MPPTSTAFQPREHRRGMAPLLGAVAAAGILLGGTSPAPAAGGFTLTGQVATWSGAPAPGRIITAFGWWKAPATSPPDRTWQTTSAADGTYAIDLTGIDTGRGVSMPMVLHVPNGGITQTRSLTAIYPGTNTATVQLNDAPTAPASASTQPIPGGVAVTWAPPDSTGGTAVTGYTARWSGPDSQTSTCTTTADVTNCQITGLSPGASGSVRVTASNAVGEGPGTNLSAIAGPATPLEPTAPDPYVTPGNPPRNETGNKRTPQVTLSPGRPRSGHRLTVRWHARHTDTVTLSWRRGTGTTHTQATSPTGRITLAGPPGTRYRIQVTAGTANAHKTYRIR